MPFGCALSDETGVEIIDQVAGAPVELRGDGRHAIAHNKLMLIDEQVVITGIK